MGCRQAVRQRTLTPSFGCSNHFTPANKKQVPKGACFFVAQVESETPDDSSGGRARRQTTEESKSLSRLADDALAETKAIFFFALQRATVSPHTAFIAAINFRFWKIRRSTSRSPYIYRNTTVNARSCYRKEIYLLRARSIS